MLNQKEYLIRFTQYHLPNGAISLEDFVCYDAEIYRKAQKILEMGAHFDAEILSTGKVSFTCEMGDSLIDIKISDNNVAVVAAVHALIENAYKSLGLAPDDEEK